MKLKKLKIKTQYDFHKYNLGYTPDPPTDEEIYLYWGMKERGIRGKVLTSIAKKKWWAEQNFTEQDYIDYAKKHCDPILPDEEEFIPRKYWAPIDQLIGEDLGVLYHPVWGLTRMTIFENFIPHSDTLVIQDCSNKKPYLTNANYEVVKKLMYGGYCDAAVCSCEVTPLPLTIYYPHRMYDWAHTKESSFIENALNDFNVDRILNLVAKFKYKRIIFLTRPFNANGDEHPRVTRIKEAYEGSDIEVINIFDEQLTKESLAITKKFGMLKMRYCRFARDKLYNILGAPLDGNFPQKYKDSDYIRKQQYDFDKIIRIPEYEPPKTFKEMREEIKNNSQKINLECDDDEDTNDTPILDDGKEDLEDFPDAQGIENKECIESQQQKLNQKLEAANYVSSSKSLF